MTTEEGEEHVARSVSSAFLLQCSDFERESYGNTQEVKNTEELKKKIKSVLEGAKLKHSCDFKNVKYWETHSVRHPLFSLANVLANTTASDPEYVFTKPKVSIFDEHSTVIGSLPFKSVFVHLPEKLFGKRDYVNIIYPAKRAHFMCSCVVALKKSAKELDISFTPGPSNDFLYPDLIVKSKECPNGVRITFVAQESALGAKYSRFLPSTGNFRPTTVLKTHQGAADPPTPYYNQRILRSLLEEDQWKRLNDFLVGKDSLRSALRLLNQWFKVRQLGEFNELFLTSFTVHLIQTEEINDKQNFVTIFNRILEKLASWNPSEALTLKANEEVDPEEFKKVFSFVFFDFSGYWNLAAGLSLDAFNRFKQEVLLTQKLIGDCNVFDGLFVEKRIFCDSYDHYFRFKLTKKQLNGLLEKFVVDGVDKNDRFRLFLKGFVEKIHKAMGERFEYLGVEILNDVRQWNVSSNNADWNDGIDFLIGFSSLKTWGSAITMGPVANEPTAKEFRAFWNNASQLRKFADTRICECMVWSDEASDAVPLSIIRFFLEKIYSVSADVVSWRSCIPKQLGSSKVVTDKINGSFTILSTTLRNMKEIPLQITNIHGVSPYLRGCEPCPEILPNNDGGLHDDHRLPSSNRIPAFTPSIEVFIKLQYSGKWGNDFEGIRRLTASFYIQIAEQLHKRNLVAVATMDCLFVVQDDVVFKLVIVHDKVYKLLEQNVQTLISNGATKIDSSIHGKRLAAYKKRFISETLIYQSLHSFSVKYKIFSTTVQMLKRWLGAHLLSDSIANIPLEMIVAAAIEQPGFAPPRTPWLSFRRVLALLSSHPWAVKPLLFDFNGAWKETDFSKLYDSFVKMRPVLPPMVIITNEDLVGSKWTTDCPSPLQLKRITTLAQSTLKILDAHITEATPIDLVSSLLTPNLAVYDMIIHMHPVTVTRSSQPADCKEPKGLPVVDFDPVEALVKALESNLHSVALFFYNKYGGDKIAVKFKPHDDVIPAKISRCPLHKLKSDNLILNKAEIIENIHILGQGIVKQIVDC